MTQPLHLVLPALLWPNQTGSQAVAGVRLPSLNTLFGLGVLQHSSRKARTTAILELFGHDQGLQAHFRRLGEDNPEPSVLQPAPASSSAHTAILCADPVHLHFAREHVLLADATDLDITHDEAEALVSALNDTFNDLEPGFGRFEACHPTRWYVHLTQPPQARFSVLDAVVGRPVALFMPEGEEARRWRQLMNEAQVVLHNHPINQAREARGRQAVNSLWLWGEGDASITPRAPAARVLSHDPLVRGLARASGAQADCPDADRADHALAADTLLVLDGLYKPSLYLDLDRWLAGLLALERDWFAPCLQALRQGRFDRLVLHAPGEGGSLQLTVKRHDLLKFWRRPRALSTLQDTQGAT